MKIIKTGFR